MCDFNENELKKFNLFLKKVLSQPTLYLRRKVFKKEQEFFQNLIDFFFSYTIEMKSYYSVKQIKHNDFKLYDFKKQVGEYFYCVINDDKTKANYSFFKLPTYLQNIFRTIDYSFIVSLLGEDFIFESIKNYFVFDKIKNCLDLPKIYNDIFAERVKREKVDVIFPIHIVDFPKYMKPEKIVYFYKELDSVKSNIKSITIRREILTSLYFHSYGLIGVLCKDKRYKMKYKLLLLYFNQDIQNVKNMYVGVGEYNNQINLLSNYKFSQLSIGKMKEFDDINLVKNYVSKFKNSKKFVVISQNSIFLADFKVNYDRAKIIDYVYDDDFNVKGLKVEYDDNIYNICFNVYNTSYIDNIENRFVKIGIVRFLDKIVRVFYNSEIVIWDKNYNFCQMCLDIKYKHAYSGLCYSCVGKLKNVVNNLSGNIKLPCNRQFDIVVDNVRFVADGEYLQTKIPKYFQLKLPLYEISDICS